MSFWVRTKHPGRSPAVPQNPGETTLIGKERGHKPHSSLCPQGFLTLGSFLAWCWCPRRNTAFGSAVRFSRCSAPLNSVSDKHSQCYVPRVLSIKCNIGKKQLKSGFSIEGKALHQNDVNNSHVQHKQAMFEEDVVGN